MNELDATTQENGFKHAARIIKIEDSTPAREAILRPKNNSEELDYQLRMDSIKLEVTVGGKTYPHDNWNNSIVQRENSENCFITWVPKDGTGVLESFHRQEESGLLYWIETLYEDFLYSNNPETTQKNKVDAPTIKPEHHRINPSYRRVFKKNKF